MKTLHKILIGTIVSAGLGLSSTARAEDKKMMTPAPGSPDAMMMEAAQKYMTPGVNHRVLDALVGKFNAKVTMVMKPGDKPQMSEGSSDYVWVMNGHFLKGDYRGTFNNQPFNGTGYWGYDMVRQEYQSVWLD